MLKLKNRTVDDHGVVFTTVENLYDFLMEDIDIYKFKIQKSEQLDVYHNSIRMTDEMDKSLEEYVPLTESVEEFDRKHQNVWNIPEKYLNLDIYTYIMERVNSDEGKIRVEQEYAKYKEYELEIVLKALLYMTDLFKEKNIVKGVGRGSSVSSYILYIIGVHKVDSIKYDLDFSEFLE